jgi:hypothetical protein
MKGNTKKLAVFVIIAAIAIFIAAAVASADDHKWKAFHGKYAGTTVGSCIIVLGDFDPVKLTPTPIASNLDYIFRNTFAQQAIWTFHADGTGTMQGTQVNLMFVPVSAGASSVDISWQFTYDVTHEGGITTTMIPGTYKGEYTAGPSKGATYTQDTYSDSGMVSEDHKTITLGSVTADIVTLTTSSNISFKGICNWGRVLTRVDE